MAGGEHGIEVAAARADEQGRFQLTGIAPGLHPLSLRIRAESYALGHVDVVDRDDDRPVIAAVQPTTRLRGSITAPAAVDLTAVCVLVRGLPGVQVYPAANGAFVLDHLPPAVEPRLFLYGLDAFHACAEVRAQRDEEVALEVVEAAVVRGRVIDSQTKEPIAGALVFAGEAAAVRSDENGRFELIQVLPGAVELTAQYETPTKKRRRGRVRFGRMRVTPQGGETLDGIELLVD